MPLRPIRRGLALPGALVILFCLLCLVSLGLILAAAADVRAGGAGIRSGGRSTTS